MSDSDSDAYITPGEAARHFGTSTRSIERAAASGKVRTRDNPRRRGKLYHLGDLQQWAGAETFPPELNPAEPGTELVPQGDLLRMLDDAHRRAEETHRRLEAAMLEVGRLQGQLESQQKLLEAGDERQRATASEAERLRRMLDRIPWWIRVLWLRR